MPARDTARLITFSILPAESKLRIDEAIPACPVPSARAFAVDLGADHEFDESAARDLAGLPKPLLLPVAGVVYSITSSARAISEGGTARPSAFAVFRFMTS